MTTPIDDELAKLAIQDAALVKRYYALLTERASKQRDAEIRRIERQLAAVRERIAALDTARRV